MTKLTYRGKAYSQNNKAAKKQYVELTYRRNVYSSRQINSSKNFKDSSLVYRGVNYSS
tara:strand:- start:4557 stop:4730 length:174 start_codon:yes stop_codon:yes gene_type:complete